MSYSMQLTLQHAKIDAHISVMREPLHCKSESLLNDADRLRELKSYSRRIGQMLDDYVHQQQCSLLLKATRILGDSLEEVCAIHEENAKLITQHRHFDALLSDANLTLDRQWLAEVKAQFDRLYACFERQSEAEREFYSQYSTIIFPAGAATD